MAKSPDKRVLNPADNYSNILRRTRESFRDINQIAEILPHIEKNRNYTSANQICEQFYVNRLSEFLRKLFTAKVPEGAALDDRNYFTFDEQKVSSERVKLANFLLALSSAFLLQAFPEEKSVYLNSRISDVIKELESNLAAFDEIKKLREEIIEYQQYTDNYKSQYPKLDSEKYSATCDFCKGNELGKTVEEAILKINHTKKCKTKHDKKELDLDKIKQYYKIIPPKIILEQYNFF